MFSPLLANVYLHPLDLLMEARGRRMARYADDFVILCRTEAEAKAALAEVEAWVADLRPRPSTRAKTRIGAADNRAEAFEFLGYRFEAGRRWVRNKSRKAIRDKVRAKTKRTRGDAMARIVPKPQSYVARLVRVLQTRSQAGVPVPRRLRPPPVARHPAQAGEAPRLRALRRRPPAMAKRLLRQPRAVHPGKQLGIRRDVPDEVIRDWRAVCGRTACTVRREGRRKPSVPLSGALAREIPFAADDQPLAGEVRHVTAAMSRSSNSDICSRPPPTSSSQRWGAQGGDPVESGGAQVLVDARLRDHASVADQHDVVDREAALELVDLIGERHGIGGVSLEHLDGCEFRRNPARIPI